MVPARLVGLAALATCAAAAGAAGTADAAPRELDYVVVDPSPAVWHAGPNVIFLDRCTSGCTVAAGRDDAGAGTSSILGRNGSPERATVAAFRWGDPLWNDVVDCMRATYAPYAVSVVTDRPAAGAYVRVLVAGEAASLNLAGNTLGVAPLTSDCSAQSSAIAFAFANAHQPGAEQALDICATAAHEAGHIYGLDHEFECKDPMTYLTGCGLKLFLNKTVACGEFDGPRACKCGYTQSSFRKLTKVLGPGPTPPGPELELISPMDGAAVSPGFSVFFHDRGRPLAIAELWINGIEVSSAPGKLTEAPYELRTGASLPDGVLHVAVRAYDDLGRLEVLTLTVQKGAACSAGGCPGDLTCDDGACVAPAGTAAVGEACATDAACASQLCAVRGDDQVCSEPCWPSGADCGGGLSCQHADDERLVCLPPPPDEGGCCGAGRRPGASLALSALVLGLLVRGRRRRRKAS